MARRRRRRLSRRAAIVVARRAIVRTHVHHETFRKGGLKSNWTVRSSGRPASLKEIIKAAEKVR